MVGVGPDKLAAELYQLIQSGELSPGQQVEQRSVALRLGVSRTPLREALKALAVDGVLVHAANQGYRVRKLGPDDLLQLYALRAFLEDELVMSLVWPDHEGLERLEARNLDCRRAVEVDEIAGLLAASRAFYFEIYGWSPLKMFLREASRLWRVSEPYRALYLARPALKAELSLRHDAVVSAVRAEDREGLVTAIRERRDRTRRILLDVVAGS